MTKGKTARLWLLILCLAAAVACSALTAGAETVSGRCGAKLYWSLDTDSGALAFTGSGAMFSYDTSQAPWLAYREQIKSVTFEEGLTGLPARAFYNCVNLADISLPASVLTVGSEAFYNCRSLTKLPLGSGTTQIGDYCFYGCRGLTELSLPGNVTSVGNGAFRNCSGATSLQIPATVTSLGQRFALGCTGLQTITVAEGNSVYRSAGDCVIARENGTLLAGCGASRIPDDGSVLAIGAYAFADLTEIKTVSLPASVVAIGECAFSGCTGLETVTFCEGLESLDYGAFMGCGNLKNADLPESLTDIGACAFSGCGSLGTVYIPTGLVELGSWAFCDTTITAAELPRTVTYIGINPFRECETLTSLTVDYRNRYYKAVANSLINSSEKRLITGSPDGSIPAGAVVTIGRESFRGTAPETVTIPEAVTSIGEYAFCGSKLQTVSLPASLLSMDTNPFRDCDDLKTIRVGEGNTAFAATDGCLIRLSDKTLVAAAGTATIPADGSVTAIGEEAFADNDRVYLADLPDTVTGIGKKAFFGCTNLLGVFIPKSVEHIEESAFECCTGLEFVVLETMPQIDSYAFTWCYKLATIYNLTDTALTLGDTVHGYLTYYATAFSDEAVFRAAICEGEALKGLYPTVETALEAYSGGYIKLLESTTVDATLNRDLYLDLNGYSLDGTLNEGGYMVYGMDSATNNYTAENMGCFSCVNNSGEATAVATHVKTDTALSGAVRRYLAVQTEEGITFHRFYIGITHMRLNTSTVGFGYKGVFFGDEYVVGAMNPQDAFGFVLYLEGNYPVRGFQPVVNVKSGRAVSLRVDNYDVENHGETPLNAYVYMKLKDGTVIHTGEYKATMRSMVEYVDAHAGGYPAGQLEYIAGLIEQFPVMKNWEVENILRLASATAL